MSLRWRDLLLASTVITAPSVAAPVQDSTRATEQRDRRLSGSWEAAFTLDSTWGTERRASGQTVRGRVLIRPVSQPPPTVGEPRTVHAGAFDIDFGPFGFSLSTRDALAWYAGRDSVRIILHPVVVGSGVEIRGALTGPTITGSWRHEAGGRGAAGRVQLRRVSAADGNRAGESTLEQRLA